MFRVSLVNPPFATLAAPSFALTQLQELLRTRFAAEELQVTVHYLNIDFAHYMGFELYDFISNSVEALNCGIGEWMFRRAAFPEVADNIETYFRRYGHHLRGLGGKSLWSQFLEKREGVETILETLLERHNLYESDLVGFSSMFAQHVASFALARKLKALKPDIITVIGGANCEAPMGDEIAKRVAALDYVFSGPALVSFPQFIEHCLSGERTKFAEIDGVIPNSLLRLEPRSSQPTQLPVLGQESSLPTSMPKKPIGRDLDIDCKIALNYKPFLDTLEEAFPGRVSPVLFFETSRGCWWGQKAHCTFCGLNGLSMSYRAMQSELAVEQFESLFQYSDRVIELQCVDNIMPKNYLKEVLPLLETPANMRIFYEVKADLSEEDMKTLALARVTRIQPGIEALATSTLKLMRKGTSAHQNVQFLKNCAKYGIEPAWNLLVGFPGEQEEVYRKYASDLPHLVHLPPPSGVFPVRFDRYSPYFVKAKEYELELLPLEFYELVYPFPAEAIARMAYFFADENVFAQYAIAVSTWITKLQELVQKWRERWSGAKAGEPPTLSFSNDGSSVILDTRAGALLKHDVGAAGRQVLEFLSVPRDISDLSRRLSTQITELGRLIERLTELGLLFEENGRLVSLLLPNRKNELRRDMPVAVEVVQQLPSGQSYNLA